MSCEVSLCVRGELFVVVVVAADVEGITDRLEKQFIRGRDHIT